MPFVLNPNALKLKFVHCRWGEKPNWPWNLIGCPQPTSKVELKSQLPSCKKKKKNDVHEQINILQTNPKLFYAYSYSSLFPFCANGGAARTTPTYSVAGLAVRAPLCLRRILYICFISSKWTVVDFVSPGGGVGDHGQPEEEWGVREPTGERGGGGGLRSATAPGLP